MKTLNVVLFLILVCMLFIEQLGCDNSSDDNGGSSGDTDTDSDGDSDTDTDSDSDSDSDIDSDMVAPKIKATIVVPDDFDGVPETIDTVFFESEDVTVEPYAFGDTAHNPEIGIGIPYTLEVGQAGLSGDYYMAVVLYCKGGGDGEDLVPGVDWVGMVDGPLSLDPMSGVVDAGTIELMLFE
jgi:hypothetical protein